jgi:hypothetical protein
MAYQYICKDISAFSRVDLVLDITVISCPHSLIQVYPCGDERRVDEYRKTIEAVNEVVCFILPNNVTLPYYGPCADWGKAGQHVRPIIFFCLY